MRRILVSACLLGHKVRYNGSDKPVADARLEKWREEGRLVPICPELAAGFDTPRPPAELRGCADGADIVAGRGGTVVEDTGNDVTALYREGAELALRLAQQQGCGLALLTDGSPSCGSTFIYDGTFQGRTKAGRGVTAALLERHGIRVFAESQLDALEQALDGDRAPHPS
ncbi:MAG TPA: DUF523 domain-containing protein [Azospirillaceae bacterium]|nr:DUF523 domain-containing protein [Azospirillaceae bacterium]